MQPPQQASAREVGFLTFMEALIFKKNWKKGVIVRSWVGVGFGERTSEMELAKYCPMVLKLYGSGFNPKNLYIDPSWN